MHFFSLSKRFLIISTISAIIILHFLIDFLQKHEYRVFNENSTLYYSSHTGTVNEINLVFNRHNISIKTALGKSFLFITSFFIYFT